MHPSHPSLYLQEYDPHRNRAIFMKLPILLIAAAIAVTAQAAPDHGPSTSIALTGALEHPRSLTLGDLKAEPATTENVFFHTGHGPVTGSYTGVSLWGLLQKAGLKLDGAAKNDIVRHVVIVTGNDGYSAILALGELDPELGGAQVIVAYESDGKPLERRGVARLIVPGDKAAARDVERISSIEVK
jgi:DMSO/TMAO reductase YedYZ molybdopterin-dependent catalytic subunit